MKEVGNVSLKANTTTVDKPTRASDTTTHGLRRTLKDGDLYTILIPSANNSQIAISIGDLISLISA